MLARFAVHPNGKTEDFRGLLIDDDARIAAPVLGLGQPAVFPHVHDDFHRLPGLAAIETAAQADVDIFLKVAAHAPPHIVDAQQRPLRRGTERCNAVRMDAVVLMFA